MNAIIVTVCMTMLVATSQAFILGNDGFQDLAMFNVVQGRSPFDFTSLFGGPRAGGRLGLAPGAVGAPGAAAGAAGGAAGATAGVPAGSAAARQAAATNMARYRAINANPLNSLFGLSMIGDMGFF